VSNINDPTPHESAMPSTVAELLALAEVRAEDERQDVKEFADRVRDLPGIPGELLRAVAFAVQAQRYAYECGAITAGEFDRWDPVVEAAQALVDDLTGGAA
jgi:hypothetical protein